MLKMLLLFSFFVLWTCSLAAGERRDSICTFYFVPCRDMFYSPYGANRTELERLFLLVESHRTALADHIIHIYVDGYCTSCPAARDNLAIARIRSNRVKSELITRMGLKETNFVTCNHAQKDNSADGMHVEKADKVVVRIHIPVDEPAVAATPAYPDTHVQSATHVLSAAPATAASPALPPVSEAPAGFRVPVTAATPCLPESCNPCILPEPVGNGSPRFALKTNLLYWAALAINAEAEYYLKRRLSLNVDWQYAWWSRKSRHKYYRLAAVSPELRYWFASRDNFRGHFGGFYVGTGLYEFMARPTHGIQGEFFIAGGLTYGYMFPLGKRLRMELSLGVGYMMTEYRQYHWDRGCYVYEKTQRYSYFGPTKAKVSLVWPLNRFRRKPRIET